MTGDPASSPVRTRGSSRAGQAGAVAITGDAATVPWRTADDLGGWRVRPAALSTGLTHVHQSTHCS